jgi:hypothetical protein
MYNTSFVFYAASLVMPAGGTLPSFTTAELVCSLFPIPLKSCVLLSVNGGHRCNS